MADAKELITALRDILHQKCESDRKLKEIAAKLQTGDYSDAHDYAIRIGELLSEAFSEVLTEEIYPEITEEIAKQVIPSLLGTDHKMISEACVTVQKNLNQNAGLGLKPIEPEFDAGKAYDLADKYVSYDKYDDAKWVLKEPVENFSQSVPDDSIRRNADFQWKSGMNPKIIRKAEPGACKWCRALAGTYDYADVRNSGNDVYRRHERCRCSVEYDPGSGKTITVWSNNSRNVKSRTDRITKLGSQKRAYKLDIQFFANITTKQKIDDFKNQFENGLINKKNRWQKQNEHIFGTKEFEKRIKDAGENENKYQGFFYEGTNVPNLLSDVLNTGEIVFRSGKELPIEFITFDKPVGKRYNIGKHMWEDTNVVAVQYSKKGWHAYPCKEKPV